MRQLQLDATIRSTPAETVFDHIGQFGRYPQLAPHVQSTTVHESPAVTGSTAATGRSSVTGRSSWELHFRSGLLRWTEREHFLRNELRLEFEQTTGDFDEFSGYWSLSQSNSDTMLHFHADFDFGIPSMEGILDPIAERVIKETVAWVLVGMFADVELSEQFELQPVRSGTTSSQIVR